MRPRTEALLTLRDGGPLDAGLRADLVADPDSMAELERLRRMQEALRALPTFEPPETGWDRLTEELDRRAPGRMRWPVKLVAGGAVAAAVALGAIGWLVAVKEPSAPPTIAVVPSSTQDTGARPVVAPRYTALVQESERLERLLARIPYQRPLMTGRTASTIVELEDRIAYIDAQLTMGNAYDMDMSQREALWGERVELMNALVYVRYAQAQPTGY